MTSTSDEDKPLPAFIDGVSTKSGMVTITAAELDYFISLHRVAERAQEVNIEAHRRQDPPSDETLIELGEEIIDAAFNIPNTLQSLGAYPRLRQKVEQAKKHVIQALQPGATKRRIDLEE